MSYCTEFPTFPADAIPADVFGDGWTDTSYRNDVAPTFGFDRFVVFVDYPNPTDREYPDLPRFRAYDAVDALEATYNNGCESDVWADILAFLANGGR